MLLIIKSWIYYSICGVLRHCQPWDIQQKSGLWSRSRLGGWAPAKPTRIP